MYYFKFFYYLTILSMFLYWTTGLAASKEIDSTTHHVSVLADSTEIISVSQNNFFPQIKLQKTFLNEGDYYVLLFNPQRIVTPFENKNSSITEYAYISYFPAFDISYTSSYADWRDFKKREKEKYGFNLSTVSQDLKTSIDGLFYTYKQKLGNSVKINWINDIKYKNYPGKEVEFQFYSQKIKYLVKCRIYIINNQNYTLINAFPEKYIGMTQFLNFLNSFELK